MELCIVLASDANEIGNSDTGPDIRSLNASRLRGLDGIVAALTQPQAFVSWHAANRCATGRC